MVNYLCSKCGKSFSQKSHYNSHCKRKTDCETNLNNLKLLIESIVDNVIEEKLYKTKLIKKIKINNKKKMTSVNEKKFSTLSVSLTKEIKKSDKKNEGIYFTPPKTIKKNIELLEPYIDDIKDVLEPSCGSCEFITQINEKYGNLKITGIEFNKKIFEKIGSFENDNIKLYNEDYLAFNSDSKYDLIIGNPPYFVIKKEKIDKEYNKYFDGRPNIFIMFIIKSLHLLNENGLLSFVLPKNFLNCLYYDKTRKYINENFQILHILECNDSYLDTQQETILLILRKVSNSEINNETNVLNVSKFTIFGTNENIIRLKNLYAQSSTLDNLGFELKIGNVVWNQCKNSLTNNKSKSLLIYSSDIKNKVLKIQKYKNAEKKNYIDKSGSTNPVLVINRGYGVGKYIFNYCLINENDNIEYCIENHLICVNSKKAIPKEELIILYKKIIKSFENKKTKEFIKLYFGNNAVNKDELSYILPIYDI